MRTEKSVTQYHLPALDHARGVAVAWVFIYHCRGPGNAIISSEWNGLWRNAISFSPQVVNSLARFGEFGVAIFFAISGFCIQLSFSHSRDRRWSTFFIRRGLWIPFNDFSLGAPFNPRFAGLANLPRRPGKLPVG